MFDVAFGKPQAILSEETVAERNGSKRGETVELSSRRKSTSGNYSLCFIVLKINSRVVSNIINAGREIDSRHSISSRSMSSRVGSINETDPNRKRGMVLPFEPLSLTFDDIHYAVDMPEVYSIFRIFQYYIF